MARPYLIPKPILISVLQMFLRICFEEALERWIFGRWVDFLASRSVDLLSRSVVSRVCQLRVVMLEQYLELVYASPNTINALLQTYFLC